MASRKIVQPAAYIPLTGLALGRDGGYALPVDRGNPLPVEAVAPRNPTFRSGVVGFVPAAAPTDILALSPLTYGRTIALESVTITGSATSPAVIDVLLQRSINGGGGTATAQPVARIDSRDSSATAQLQAFTANRTSAGNGIDSNRPLLGCGKLHLGSATTPGTALTFCFSAGKRPLIRDLTEWLVINLAGAAMPAGAQFNIFVEWSEETRAPVQFAGDSTTSNAVTLFRELGNTGALTASCNFNNSGSNGARLEDVLKNINAAPYPLVSSGGILTRINAMPGVLVLSYGINDLRTGARSRADLVSMIDAALQATINGTVSGETYTSPLGSNMPITWSATVAANPDTRIILWAPNSLTLDGNGSSFVTLTGRFAGMTLDAAAQTITDDLFEAYDVFRDDPRVFRLVHKQDIFGRTCRTLAENGLMTDILHPNARGQTMLARQIAPLLREAVASAMDIVV